MGGSHGALSSLMESVVWAQISFDAAHNPAWGPCPDTSGLHGHRYSIRAYRSTKLVVGVDHRNQEFTDALHGIRTELQGTVIDDMMVGASTDLFGIAAWVLERLPLASAVRVKTDDDFAAEVRR